MLEAVRELGRVDHDAIAARTGLGAAEVLAAVPGVRGRVEVGDFLGWVLPRLDEPPEFDAVVVAGVQDGVWPNVRLRGGLLQTWRLPGALAAASWGQGKKPGLYSMSDVLGLDA